MTSLSHLRTHAPYAAAGRVVLAVLLVGLLAATSFYVPRNASQAVGGERGTSPAPAGASSRTSPPAPSSSVPRPMGLPRTVRPGTLGGPPPTTSINGSVDINGSLVSSTTYLNGSVAIDGSAVTENYTTTDGWANYGPTVVTGSMAIASQPGSVVPTFATTPGSSLWVQPYPANASGLNVLDGDLQLGNGVAGDTFDMTANGVNLTIDAGAAGGFYSYPSSSANIEVANYSVIRNYLNSTSSLSADACVFGICATTTIAPGAVFLVAALACVPLLGCVASIPMVKITWSGPVDFTILGSLGTSGQGMTATLPDTRMGIAVPAGYLVNISLTPDVGAPSLTVTPPTVNTPAEVITEGRVVVSAGEALNASVVVQGSFQAAGHVDNGGSFLNIGGLTLLGGIASTGEQVFAHKLQIGPQVNIHTFPGGNVTARGATLLDSVAELTGSLVATGDLTVQGTLSQNATLVQLEGDLSLNGTMSATGAIATEGTTTFSGALSSTGDLSLPNAFMDGSFLLQEGTFVGNGGTLLTGTSVAHGWTWVSPTVYSVTGASWLNGTVAVNGSIAVNGRAELLTAPGAALRLTATILMGTGVGPAGWTSRVEGSVLVRGASFANGSSSFNGTLVTFPSGLSVLGSVEAQGNVSVEGTSAFSGAVTTTGFSRFPGMTLSGTFALSASGGDVNATGTTEVAGNATLVGTLGVDHGVFSEVGTSVILGDMTMTGNVSVLGSSTLSTAAQTVLSLTGNIDLAGAAHILGNVNTTGRVTISGSASLGPDGVVIGGALEASGAVYARGDIRLSGRADFQGDVSTLGSTQLPGLFVAGNYSLSAGGSFVLDGQIGLQGFTISTGTVVANSTGYYVVGPSRIVGHTTATGSFTVTGSSTTEGYVDLGDGATLGTYTVVHGEMSAGGIPLSGTILLPNDTVTFPQGANISGMIWQSGVLSSGGTSVSFLGESNVTGTVTSPGTPTLVGPVVAEVYGRPFALTLGPEFFAFVAGLLGLVAVAGIELLRLGWKRRRPLSSAALLAVRRLRLEAVLVPPLLAAGSLLGTWGGYSVGGDLWSASPGSPAGSVVDYFVVADVLLFVGLALWVVHRWRYTRSVRSSREPSTVAHPPVPSPMVEVEPGPPSPEVPNGREETVLPEEDEVEANSADDASP